MSLAGLKVTLVGPLPPPEGGMANQTRQLAELLEREGAVVAVVRTNTPYFPSWVQKWRFVREPFRLAPFIVRLWRAAGDADVFHVMANSGWAWHLCAAPAILIAWARSVPCVVNYRGGEAQPFLERSRRLVLRTLGCANVLAVPSGFLQQVFARWGVHSDIVPNIIDLERFRPGSSGGPVAHLVVARSLEPIYDIATALRAFALVRKDLPEAKLTVAGTGPDEPALRRLATDLAISEAVHFCGRLDRDQMAELYRASSVVLNPSRVDNMPNSVLEAMASGAPVVSTNVGGVPFILRDGATALLVDAGDHAAMAAGALRVLRDTSYATQLREAALREVQQYAWQRIRQRWASIYAAACTGHAGRDKSRMTLYTKFVAGVLFPLQEQVKKHDTVAVRRSLDKSQWWDAGQLQSLQLSRLQALLRHAADEVPYYREVFNRIDFAPAQVRALSDLARLPLLTKANIRAHLNALKSDKAGDLTRYNTGGSSGEPLIFFLGNERVSHDVAAKWRATRWWGVDIGDSELVVWGSPIELAVQDRVRQVRDALMRTELLPAFEMSDERLDAFVQRIRRRRPRMLFGYPSALAHIARHAEERRVQLNRLGIQVAFVTSEKLYDEQRRDIERIFGCRVANGYGSREAGFIAHECPAGGMHVTAEDIIVEIIDESGRPLGTGQAGEIVVTHLATRQFPFIRYRTGDVGVLSAAKCPCGRGLPLLKEIHGRSTDFLVAQDGTVMHGLALIYVVRDIQGVRQFKVIQESIDRTRVLLATDEGFNERDLETIRQGIRRRLGTTVKVQIDRVGQIPREASGKYRYVVSHVDPRRSTAVAA